MLREGRVSPPVRRRDVLTPDHVRELYDVNADVQVHALPGHLVVVPVSRVRP